MVNAHLQHEDLYPSRMDAEAVWIPRKDPVVHAPKDREPAPPLTAERVNDFARDGFLSIPSLFTPLQPLPQDGL